jgi:hypothetical protein
MPIKVNLKGIHRCICILNLGFFKTISSFERLVILLFINYISHNKIMFYQYYLDFCKLHCGFYLKHFGLTELQTDYLLNINQLQFLSYGFYKN